MKTPNEIVNSLNEIDLLSPIDTTNHPFVKICLDFYEKYPQFSELDPKGVWFILQAIRTKHKPVKVHQFINGSIWFVGDILTAENAPIASIGEWSSPANGAWVSDLKEYSTVVGEIIWSF